MYIFNRCLEFIMQV